MASRCVTFFGRGAAQFGGTGGEADEGAVGQAQIDDQDIAFKQVMFVVEHRKALPCLVYVLVGQDREPSS